MISLNMTHRHADEQTNGRIVLTLPSATATDLTLDSWHLQCTVLPAFIFGI